MAERKERRSGREAERERMRSYVKAKNEGNDTDTCEKGIKLVSHQLAGSSVGQYPSYAQDKRDALRGVS